MFEKMEEPPPLRLPCGSSSICVREHRSPQSLPTLYAPFEERQELFGNVQAGVIRPAWMMVEDGQSGLFPIEKQ
jgi:hypothetical protein